MRAAGPFLLPAQALPGGGRGEDGEPSPPKPSLCPMRATLEPCRKCIHAIAIGARGEGPNGSARASAAAATGALDFRTFPGAADGVDEGTGRVADAA